MVRAGPGSLGRLVGSLSLKVRRGRWGSLVVVSAGSLGPLSCRVHTVSASWDAGSLVSRVRWAAGFTQPRPAGFAEWLVTEWLGAGFAGLLGFAGSRPAGLARSQSG